MEPSKASCHCSRNVITFRRRRQFKLFGLSESSKGRQLYTIMTMQGSCFLFIVNSKLKIVFCLLQSSRVEKQQ